VSLDFLPWTSGSSLGVTRSVFEEIGGFDESMVRGEDIDFCWRAQLAGYPLVPAPDAIVHYRNRSSGRGALRQGYSKGRAAGDLLVRYRSFGARRRSVKRALRAWGWLVLHVPDVARSPQARLGYCSALGVSLGRVRGSLANRVLCL
jgi:GT2 family glycosyltransferase